MTYTANEIARRYEDVKDTIATLRLEGIELDATTKEDLMAEARGETTMDEIRAKVHARIAKGEL